MTLAPAIPNDCVSISSKRMTHNQRYNRARLIFSGRRDQIAAARKATEWRDKRPAEWFAEQEGILAEIADIGAELAFIAKHAASYDAWKASIIGGAR